MARNISFTIKYWRQNGPKDQGHFDTHEMKDIPDDTSFLEMLDILNEELIEAGEEPFVFDHDCREGICGMCSLYINGTPHGKTERGATTCQLYMRRFNDGDVITVEPWRSAAFPVIKDCMVDRSAFDKIIAAGGYNTIRTGQAQDANAILIPKENADEAMDCATCIGCGACVAACKNGSAMLFLSSKVSQLALLPQGRPEAAKRAKNMIAKMEELQILALVRLFVLRMSLSLTLLVLTASISRQSLLINYLCFQRKAIDNDNLKRKVHLGFPLFLLYRY